MQSRSRRAGRARAHRARVACRRGRHKREPTTPSRWGRPHPSRGSAGKNQYQVTNSDSVTAPEVARLHRIHSLFKVHGLYFSSKGKTPNPQSGNSKPVLFVYDVKNYKLVRKG